MAISVDLERMRSAAQDGRIEWRVHALKGMMERIIRRSDVLSALASGELIEDYPDDEPFPSGLFLGWVESRALHVVVAFDAGNDQVFVITAYEPDLMHFEPGFRTRRTT